MKQITPRNSASFRWKNDGLSGAISFVIKKVSIDMKLEIKIKK